MCPCESQTDEYGCNICGNNTESCGTIILVDGSCWECCCGSEGVTTPPPVSDPKACCPFSGGECVEVYECGECDGSCYPGQTCETFECPREINACCDQSTGNCLTVSDCSVCPDGYNCIPGSSCADVDCGGDDDGGTTPTTPPPTCCDFCAPPTACCNEQTCQCEPCNGGGTTPSPSTPSPGSGPGGPEEGGVWCCAFGTEQCDCSSWPSNFCCVYSPPGVKPDCGVYDDATVYGSEAECYEACCAPAEDGGGIGWEVEK